MVTQGNLSLIKGRHLEIKEDFTSIKNSLSEDLIILGAKLVILFGIHMHVLVHMHDWVYTYIHLDVIILILIMSTC